MKIRIDPLIFIWFFGLFVPRQLHASMEFLSTKGWIVTTGCSFYPKVLRRIRKSTYPYDGKFHF